MDANSDYYYTYQNSLLQLKEKEKLSMIETAAKNSYVPASPTENTKSNTRLKRKISLAKRIQKENQ